MLKLDPSCELVGYLVRHGELNITKKWDGWGNFVLSQEGKDSVEKSGEWLAFQRIGRLIASDLPRTLQSAEIIMNCCECACPYLATDPNLRAWNIGIFTGKEKTDERKEEFQHYRDNPDEAIPEGESFNSFRDRVNVAFQYLCSPYNALPTVIVTHNSVLKGLMDIDEKGDLVDPGGVVAVYLDAQGEFQFEVVMGATKMDGAAGLATEASCG